MPKKLTGSILLVSTGLDASDVRYASGFVPVDPVVFLKQKNKRYLVVPLLELGRAKQTTHKVNVLTPSELPISRKQQRSLAGWALGIVQYAGVRTVTVSRTFPVGIAEELKKAGIKIRIADRRLFPERDQKTADEILHLRESQRAAVAAMKEGIKLIKKSTVGPGNYLKMGRRRLTSEDVRLAIETTLLQHNTWAKETIVAGGRQGADPHDRGHGPLKAGEPIVIDIFPQHKDHGYWGDITRTVIKGQATPEQKQMYNAVKTAQQRALRMLKPGIMASRVHQVVDETFKERGFKTFVRDGIAEGFFHSTGHGVGLDIHEGPSLSHMGGRLRMGQVITVEPGLYYPTRGGVRIEDTVVLTKTGWEYLATCEKKFEL